MHRHLKLGYLALNVTNMEASKKFYESMVGLNLTEIGANGEHFFRCSDDHHNIVLYKKDQASLKRIGWELESESDMNQLYSALERSKVKVREVDAAERAFLHQGRTIRFEDPFTGAVHEYYTDQRRLGGTPFEPTVAKIQKLGHVVLKTPRYEDALAFYMDVLNFRSSDFVEGMITFMRAFPIPYHHSFGLAKSDKGAMHHLNFMVSEVDDIGKGMWRYKKNDVVVVRGPGRHPPSGAMFLYALDPDGHTVEYSFGMEEFPEVSPRKPRQLPPLQESIDFWGAPTDPRMGATGNIEKAEAAPAKTLQPA
jgi:2,3-dihydroxy-p-cumate/2,3-dihydroxybenzoate 3,4-dioxygenase